MLHQSDNDDGYEIKSIAASPIPEKPREHSTFCCSEFAGLRLFNVIQAMHAHA